MADKFSSYADSPLAGSTIFAAVTPHDTNAIDRPKAIYVGQAGDITMVGADNVAVLFKAVPIGTHAFRPTIVKATGTTASGIVALY